MDERDKSVACLPTRAPSDHEMMVYQTMAKTAVESQMYRGIGKEAGVMMIMLAARELGIPPMQALNKGLQIIDGNVEISARMMNAMVRRAGHKITIKESSDDKCTLIGKRRDTGDTATVTYSIGDAQKAGLIRDKGGWKRTPADMCFARAISRLCRQLFPDIIGIGYVEGEISGEKADLTRELNVETEPEIIEVQPDTFYKHFIDQFDDIEIRAQWKEYIEVVSHKLNWSLEKTVEEFMKDMTKTHEKFNKWKTKEQK